MNTMSRRSVMIGLPLALSLSPRPARAQTYPQRSIRVIVPYAAGGASDIIARLVATNMGQELGQSLYVDNRAGGASMIGTQAIATAAADGYTLGVVDTAFTINPGLFGSRLTYDTRRDFAPLSLLAKTALVLVVPESLPVKDVQGLIALAKSKPGAMTMATAGLGTAVHLCCEQFRQEAGIDVTTVPYRGGGPSLVDLLSAKVDFTFSTIPAILENVRAGKLKALGITAGSAPQLPGVPSMADVGLPKVDAAPDFGLVGPAKLPAPIVERLAKVAQSVVKSDALQNRLREIGYEPVGSTPAEYGAYIDKAIEKWRQIIVAGNIKPE